MDKFQISQFDLLGNIVSVGEEFANQAAAIFKDYSKSFSNKAFALSDDLILRGNQSNCASNKSNGYRICQPCGKKSRAK